MKGNIRDKDITSDLEYLGGILEKNLKILISFQKYVKEFNTQALEWNPVHSEKFQKEKVEKFRGAELFDDKNVLKLKI